MSDKITQYRNVDSLGRIVIPRYMRNRANINSNDMLKITYNESEKTIQLEKEERHEYLQKISTDILKPLYMTLSCPIIVTDCNKIICVYCNKDDGLVLLKDKDISERLKDLISNEHRIKGIVKSIKITDDNELKTDCYYIKLKEQNSTIGSAIIMCDRKISKDLIDYLMHQLYMNF